MQSRTFCLAGTCNIEGSPCIFRGAKLAEINLSEASREEKNQAT